MVTEQSPTVRKLRLGIELRRLRLQAGRSMLEAADHVARTDSSISRMETGQVAVSHRVLDKLCHLYEATPEEHEALRILATEARRRGWWHTYGDALPAGFDVYLGLEAEAAGLWSYEPAVVPGLLQTEDYARALMRAEPYPVPDEEMSARIAVRTTRQERLLQRDDQALWIVLHEAVLHHHVGGIEVMAEQLRRLISLSREGRLSLQVLPFTAGAHPAMHVGGFAVLSVPLGGESTYDIAYLEHRSGSLYLDKAAEVDEHKLVFHHLRAKALDREDSRAMISRVVRKVTSD
jgi:transcriptional regulator with XRE-family HTH domain